MTNPPSNPSRSGRVLRWLAAAALAAVAGPGQAWSNHALCTWPALSALPEVNGAATVEAESLAHFVAADPAALAQLLEQEEAWARAHVPTYPPRPDMLALSAVTSVGDPVARFVAALRINPAARLALFLQLRPGQSAAGRPRLAEGDVTIVRSGEATKLGTFVALREGESVAPLDVIATATDEPDYGMDLGLWSDNGTLQGAAYGFGKQPFGNPKVEISSQSPLHLGFYHEAAIVYRAAPFLQRTYPEYRIHLWRSLAAFAFRTGHPYWGWRFAGWGLHYVQDLAQPYHARVLPGVGTLRMLWINTLDIAGMHQPKERAITFVTNRHFAMENFELHWLRAAHLDAAKPDPGIEALRDTSGDTRETYADDWPRRVVSAQAYEDSDAIDEALVASLPARYTSDPDYTFGVTEPGIDTYAELGAKAPALRAAMVSTLTPLLRRVGQQSRAYVRSLARTPG